MKSSMLFPSSHGHVRKFAAFLFFAVCFAVAGLHAQTPIASFPGAVGYGAATTGGWSLTGTNHTGGTVYHVTNLNDSGAGSLRTGVGTGGNIVVFDVGGCIQLLSPMSVSSNVSIEGQTAPGGIEVYGCETSLSGRSNIIIRYVSFMDGTLDPNYPGSSATNSHTNAVNMGSTTNILLDHCSFEFAAYNNIDSAGAVNVTISNCIFANPIKEQQFNCHFETGPVTFIDNLWANSHGRNPLGKGNMQYVNNIVYNYQYAMTTGNSSGNFLWDVVNNYFIAGPSTTSAGDDYYQVDSNQSAYAIGNFLDSNKDGTLNGSSANNVGGAKVLPTYWSNTTTSLPTISAAAAFYDVISNAGPVPHGQVDSQVVGNVLSLGNQGMLWGNQTSTGLGNDGYGVIVGGLPLPDSDGNGMPDDWKAAKGLSLTNAAIGSQTSSTGYTNLENYLSWKALPNAFVAKNTSGLPTSVTIDLSKYANGFGTTATYAISNVLGGTATQTGTAPYLVKFVPTVNTSGLGGFNWTVTNSTTTMSSTCGVLISQSGPSQPVKWNGNGSTNPWDTSSLEWTSLVSGSTVAFGSGDPVFFDDTGSTNPAVNITTAVSPGSMDFEGQTSNYVLAGSGAIGGTGGLQKDSLGTLTIRNTTANTFSGGVVVNSGTLVLDQSVGTGPINLEDGTGLTLNTSIAGNTLNVDGFATILAQNGDVFGAITGAGTISLGPETGNPRFDMDGSMAAFTGSVLFGNSSVQFRFNGSTGSTAASFDLGNNGSQMYPRNGNNATYSLGSLTGGTNSILGGAASDTVPMVWSVGGNNANTIFQGKLQGTGMSLTKVGTGVLTLTGNSPNYTGTTNVNNGYLQVFAPQGNSSITVNSGGTLITNTTINGIVTLNAGSFLFPGGSTSPGDIGTLVSGSGFSVNGGSGATIFFDLSSSASATGSNDQINVPNGSLNLTGVVNLQFNLTNGVLGPGPYQLITGNATQNGSPTLVTNIPPTNRQNIFPYRPSAGTKPGYLYLSVTGTAGALTWTGTNGATWDLNTTADWTGATPNTFYNLDSVTFNDTDANGSVVLTGTLQPSFVYVNNNATNYVFSGGGGLGGNSTLVKTGTGSLTIGNSGNVGSGPIYIDAGTLWANAWMGNGTIYLNGGTLTVENGTYLGQSVVVETSGTINSVNGSNWITNNPGTSLTSTGPVTLYVGVNNSAALTIPGAMDGFQGTFEMGASAGLVRFDGDGSGSALFDIGSSTGWFANRNGNATVNFGALAGGPNTTLGGRQSGSGPTTSTYIEGALNTNSTFAGTITTGGDLGGLNITKAGIGNWTLSGTSSFTGNIEVVGGTLTITGSDNNNGLNFEVQSGGTFALLGGMVNTEVVQIDQGATFTGYGTLYASLVNQGTETVSGPLTVNGNFENDGTMTVTGSGNLIVNLPTDGSGNFVNNGLLDIMDSPNTLLPAGFVNNGTILTSSLVTVKQFSKTGSIFSVSIQSYSGHTYQLQKSNDLNTWQNVGSSQSGATGTTLTLTDSSAPASGGTFYHVAVGP